MRFVKDKALIINIITMVILIITAVCNFIFYDGSKLFRIGLMAVALWLMYFVYKKTFLRKSRISFYLIFSFIVPVYKNTSCCTIPIFFLKELSLIS